MAARQPRKTLSELMRCPLPITIGGIFNIALEQDPGVVEQDIQPPVVLANGVDHPRPICFAARVMLNKQCLRTDLFSQGQATATSISLITTGTFTGEQQRRCPAHATGPTGNQRHLACNTCAHKVTLALFVGASLLAIVVPGVPA